MEHSRRVSADMWKLLLLHFDKERLRVKRHINGSIHSIEIFINKTLVARYWEQGRIFESLIWIGLNDGFLAITVEERKYKENVVGSERMKI